MQLDESHGPDLGQTGDDCKDDGALPVPAGRTGVADGLLCVQRPGQPKGMLDILHDKLREKFTETEAREIFVSYDVGRANKLSRYDLIRFLMDLQEANGWPPAIPLAMLEKVINALVLDPQKTGDVKWTEWKSFFFYLQDEPLNALHTICTSFFTKQELELAKLVTYKHQPQGADEEYTDNEYMALTRRMLGMPSAARGEGGVFPFFDPERRRVTVLALVGETLGQPAPPDARVVRVAPYTGQVFPPIQRSGDTNLLSKTLAQTILATKAQARKLEQWDEENLQIKQRTQSALKAGRDLAQDVDNRLKISQKTQAGWDATKNVVKAGWEKTKAIGQHYQISSSIKDKGSELKVQETVSQAAQGWKAFGSAIAESEPAQAAWGWFSSAKNYVSQTVAETFDLVDDAKEADQRREAELSPERVAKGLTSNGSQAQLDIIEDIAAHNQANPEAAPVAGTVADWKEALTPPGASTPADRPSSDAESPQPPLSPGWPKASEEGADTAVIRRDKDQYEAIPDTEPPGTQI